MWAIVCWQFSICRDKVQLFFNRTHIFEGLGIKNGRFHQVVKITKQFSVFVGICSVSKTAILIKRRQCCRGRTYMGAALGFTLPLGTCGSWIRGVDNWESAPFLFFRCKCDNDVQLAIWFFNYFP